MLITCPGGLTAEAALIAPLPGPPVPGGVCAAAWAAAEHVAPLHGAQHYRVTVPLLPPGIPVEGGVGSAAVFVAPGTVPDVVLDPKAASSPPLLGPRQSRADVAAYVDPYADFEGPLSELGPTPAGASPAEALRPVAEALAAGFSAAHRGALAQQANDRLAFEFATTVAALPPTACHLRVAHTVVPNPAAAVSTATTAPAGPAAGGSSSGFDAAEIAAAIGASMDGPGPGLRAPSVEQPRQLSVALSVDAMQAGGGAEAEAARLFAAITELRVLLGDADPPAPPALALVFSCEYTLPLAAASSAAPAVAQQHWAIDSDGAPALAVAVAAGWAAVTSGGHAVLQGHEALCTFLPDAVGRLARGVLAPMRRWLDLALAFRAVFGAPINDARLAPAHSARALQFFVVDEATELGVIVTVQSPAAGPAGPPGAPAAATKAQALPVVTFASTQHCLASQAVAFAWVPPEHPPEVENPGAVAASALEFLQANFAKFRRVCEERGYAAA